MENVSMKQQSGARKQSRAPKVPGTIAGVDTVRRQVDGSNQLRDSAGDQFQSRSNNTAWVQCNPASHHVKQRIAGEWPRGMRKEIESQCSVLVPTMGGVKRRVPRRRVLATDPGLVQVKHHVEPQRAAYPIAR